MNINFARVVPGSGEENREDSGYNDFKRMKYDSIQSSTLEDEVSQWSNYSCHQSRSTCNTLDFSSSEFPDVRGCDEKTEEDQMTKLSDVP
jgi:hypothetical protein